VDTTITTLEFCAGYGGIGLGLKNIFGERMRTIAYCELEGYAQANLLSKMEKGLMDVAPLWNDLKTFPYESFHGLVDILIAGYPCQPFSSAGNRAGKEDPRHLWPWIADGIQLLQPRMCFFENVEGHISLGLSTVISDLEELGYKSSFGVFSASEVGAVHQRKRVFIMAHRNDEGLQGGKWFWQAGTQGSSSGHAAECSSNTWPSRPGKPQYAWEPPRVVGNAKHQRSQGQCNNNSSMHRENERIYIGESNGSKNELGNSECRRRAGGDVNWATTKDIGAGCINGNQNFNRNEIKPEMGRDINGTTYGVDIAELSGLCHSELEEIREWMVKGDNRTDELRSCGNGVVPVTAERAFRILMEELLNK